MAVLISPPRALESIHRNASPRLNNSKAELDIPIDIIDIRHDAVGFELKDDILRYLEPESGPKKLPTLLLYDEKGLQLFEEVSSSLWKPQMPRTGEAMQS